MKIPKWATEKITVGALDLYYGSNWDADDFLIWVPEVIELNKFYFFGFERSKLCKVISIEPFKYIDGDGTELYRVELELILDLDENKLTLNSEAVCALLECPCEGSKPTPFKM